MSYCYSLGLSFLPCKMRLGVALDHRGSSSSDVLQPWARSRPQNSTYFQGRTWLDTVRDTLHRPHITQWLCVQGVWGVCVCIYKHVCAHACWCLCVHGPVHVCTCIVSLCVYMCVLCTHKCICVRVHVHTYVWCACTCVHIHTTMCVSVCTL